MYLIKIFAFLYQATSIPDEPDDPADAQYPTHSQQYTIQFGESDKSAGARFFAQWFAPCSRCSLLPIKFEATQSEQQSNLWTFYRNRDVATIRNPQSEQQQTYVYSNLNMQDNFPEEAVPEWQ